jgi:UDP-2,3-diacylglucosamine hydrolase
LVGDIFDLWVGGDKFFARRYPEVVSLVSQLKAKAVEVIYFEGNHDLHLQKFWSDELGCQVFTAPRYFDLGRARVRVEHGDQMNPDDKGYLLLRAFLRTGFMESVVRILPGSVIQAIGNSMSRSSRKWTSSSIKARDDEAIRKMIRAHAMQVFEDDEPFDFIVSGHVHTRDDFSWQDVSSGRTARSVNLGCWLRDVEPKAFCLSADGIGRWDF